MIQGESPRLSMCKEVFIFICACFIGVSRLFIIYNSVFWLQTPPRLFFPPVLPGGCNCRLFAVWLDQRELCIMFCPDHHSALFWLLVCQGERSTGSAANSPHLPMPHPFLALFWTSAQFLSPHCIFDYSHSPRVSECDRPAAGRSALVESDRRWWKEPLGVWGQKSKRLCVILCVGEHFGGVLNMWALLCVYAGLPG